MKSQLWQRIRAARKFADLRQQDIAGPCGVGRSTVALWESKMEENRTKPDLDQLKTLAKLTSLPLDFFINDNADPDDVWKIGAQHKPAQIGPPVSQDKMLESFIRAVEFEVMQHRPDLAQGFSAAVGSGLARIRADFFYGKQLIVFRIDSQGMDHAALANLLLLEKAAGRPLDKTIISWVREGSTQADDFTEEAFEVFDVMTYRVRTPAEAASLILGNS